MSRRIRPRPITRPNNSTRVLRSKPSWRGANPKRVSASPGLWNPSSNHRLIFSWAAGRAIEAIQTSHPAAISTSGGKLAAFTRRLYFADRPLVVRGDPSRGARRQKRRARHLATTDSHNHSVQPTRPGCRPSPGGLPGRVLCRSSAGRRAMGPPPATRPTPTSHCEKTAFSRLAKLMSAAKVISLPLPVARPADQGNRHKGRASQAYQDIRPPPPSPVGPWWNAGEAP